MKPVPLPDPYSRRCPSISPYVPHADSVHAPRARSSPISPARRFGLTSTRADAGPRRPGRHGLATRECKPSAAVGVEGRLRVGRGEQAVVGAGRSPTAHVADHRPADEPVDQALGPDRQHSVEYVDLSRFRGKPQFTAPSQLAPASPRIPDDAPSGTSPLRGTGPDPPGQHQSASRGDTPDDPFECARRFPTRCPATSDITPHQRGLDRADNTRCQVRPGFDPDRLPNLRNQALARGNKERRTSRALLRRPPRTADPAPGHRRHRPFRGSSVPARRRPIHAAPEHSGDHQRSSRPTRAAQLRRPLCASAPETHPPLQRRRHVPWRHRGPRP